MKKRRITVPLVLATMSIILVSCGSTAQIDAPAGTEMHAEAAPHEVPETGWEPVLEIERLDSTGAIILFQVNYQPEGCLILSGNDYVLQVHTNNGWEDLPASQDYVYWVKDAFVISAVPRDDVDWEWLYGELGPGQYRIGKEVALYQNDQVLERTTVYAEFSISGQEAHAEEEATEAFDASQIQPGPVSYPYQYSPLSADTRYSYQKAMFDNVVILENGSAIENQHVWHAFVQAAAAGQSVSIRCIQLGDDYGFPAVYDVSFDGIFYTMTWFEDGQEKSFSFKHMLCYRDDPDTNTALRYVLVMDRDATWDDIQWGMVSGNELDAVSHVVVYQELRYVPAHPPVPENGTVELMFRGENLLTATEDQAALLTALLSEAKYSAKKPDALYNGLDLVFTAEDGSQVTLWLSFHKDWLLYNGSFYSYSTEKLLSVFNLQEWPDAVIQAGS